MAKTAVAEEPGFSLLGRRAVLDFIINFKLKIFNLKFIMKNFANL
jgi:hypothetical protein